MPTLRTKKRYVLLAIAAVVVFQSCRVARGPAGFWKLYRPEFVVSQHSDQGPWGGERQIEWRTANVRTFSFAEAKAFAERQGWKLLAQTRYESPPLVAPAAKPHEPHFLPIPSTVGRFDSAWIREDPGSGDASTAFGYVQVSDDGTRMYVYHFWGNG
jgi:hypothetical protein